MNFWTFEEEEILIAEREAGGDWAARCHDRLPQRSESSIKSKWSDRKDWMVSHRPFANVGGADARDFYDHTEKYG